MRCLGNHVSDSESAIEHELDESCVFADGCDAIQLEPEVCENGLINLHKLSPVESCIVSIVDGDIGRPLPAVMI